MVVQSARMLACLILLGLSSHSVSGTWTDERVMGGELDTYLYIPDSEPALSAGRALMVSLHGCVQRNETIRESGNWETVADEYGMVVAVPQASGEGGLYGWLGCWHFHEGPEASRNDGDQAHLVALVQELLADETLNIDPAQVYLTGLSSGGGIANQLWCMAPDLFAGVGVSAGPAPGSTGARSDLKSPSVSVEEGREYCLKYAAQQNGISIEELLNTQLWNTVHGVEDDVVVPAHADRNAEIALSVYSEFSAMSVCDDAASATDKASVSQWCDAQGPRVSKVLVNGMGHAWPAGSGEGFFVDGEHLNYPAWITRWFFANNRRLAAE